MNYKSISVDFDCGIGEIIVMALMPVVMSGLNMNKVSIKQEREWPENYGVDSNKDFGSKIFCHAAISCSSYMMILQLPVYKLV